MKNRYAKKCVFQLSFRILFLKSELPQPHLGFHAVIAKGNENLPFFLLDVA